MNKNFIRQVDEIFVWLCDYYRLIDIPHINSFLEFVSDDCQPQVLTRHHEDSLELGVLFPERIAKKFENNINDVNPNHYAVVIEEVSHFIYIANNASRYKKMTSLEIEIQAEIDKFILLAKMPTRKSTSNLMELWHNLYKNVRFAHEPVSRYKKANYYASLFWIKLIRNYQLDVHSDNLN